MQTERKSSGKLIKMDELNEKLNENGGTYTSMHFLPSTLIKPKNDHFDTH